MKCPKCGVANKESDTFCKKCGAALQPPPPTPKPESKEIKSIPKPMTMKQTYMIAGAIVVVGVIIAIAILASRPAEPGIPDSLKTPPIVGIVSSKARLEDIYAGKPVICTLVQKPVPEEGDVSIESFEVRWEYPKASLTAETGIPPDVMEDMPDFVSMGGDLFEESIIKDFSSGRTYAHLGVMLGPYWWETSSMEEDDLDVPPPEIMFEDPADGSGVPSFDCVLVPDIPDSEFMLPTNAVVKDVSELTEDFADQTFGNIQMDYLDLGYPLACIAKGTYQGTEYDRRVYFEQDKYAEDDRETKLPISASDGKSVYAYVAQGDYWLDVTQAEGVMTNGKHVLVNYLDMRSNDFFIACLPVSDIADYKFLPPAGANINEGGSVVLESRYAGILQAISQGESMQCRVQGTAYGNYLDTNLYIEGPLFMMEEWGTEVTINLFDGRDMYENYDTFWEKTPEGQKLDASDLIRAYEGAEGLTVLCVELDDIPDSYFQLPPGAVLLGATPSADIDEAVSQGYPVICTATGSREHNLYLEGSKFAIENLNEDWFDNSYQYFISDGSKLYKYQDIDGEAGWLDVTDKYAAFTPEIIYNDYASKRDAGEITLDCRMVDDLAEERFKPF